MAQIEKRLHYSRKTSAVGLSKHVQIKALSPVPFPGKVDYLLQYLGYICPETGWGYKSKGKNQNLTKLI